MTGIATAILGAAAIVTNIQTCHALNDSKLASQHQWKQMQRQNDLLERQISDAEAVARASVVFVNTRIVGFPKHPFLEFTLRNVGQTTASEITAGPTAGSGAPLKALKKSPEAAFGPGKYTGLGSVLTFNPPRPEGFSLGQGQTKDFKWPLQDWGREMKMQGIKQPKGFITLTFDDIWRGRGSFWTEMLFTYLDASGKPRLTADCLAYSDRTFVPCWGGHEEK